MSAAEEMPLSLTRVASAGAIAASWTDVSSEVVNVRRSRLFTPISFAPLVAARFISSA